MSMASNRDKSTPKSGALNHRNVLLAGSGLAAAAAIATGNYGIGGTRLPRR